jgi:hypothetical protein
MMQHMAATTDASAARPGSGSDRAGRMMLGPPPPDRTPAVSFGSTLFQRIRIVFVPGTDGDARSTHALANVVGELPQWRGPAAHDAFGMNALKHARRLRGEILCDGAGRLYERIGHYVQPVHQLVSGPHGEVLDLAPPAPRSLRGDLPPIDVDEDSSVARTLSGPRGERAAVASDLAVGCGELPTAASVPAYHQILSPPLKPRVVRFGEFKHVLGPQLRHPERLRDSHRLSCRVQVYEATRSQRLERLASDVFEGATGVLLPLTAGLATTLELTGLMGRKRPFPPPSREPGTIAAGERVVRLSVVDDPTVVPPALPPETAPSTETVAIRAHATTAPPGDRAMKTAIPERFAGPWPFTVSRDQAVCDLNLDRARSWTRRLIDRLRGAAIGGRERRKWQSLLQGRSLDDQLWTVPPPRGGLCDRGVQDWARRTLTAAAYDADAMLLEWEIFWRRKGL